MNTVDSETYENICRHVFLSGRRKGETCGARYKKTNEFGLCSTHLHNYLKLRCMHKVLKSTCEECLNSNQENINADNCCYKYRNGAICGTHIRQKNKFNLCSQHKASKLAYYCKHEIKRTQCNECAEQEKLRSKVIAYISKAKFEEIRKFEELRAIVQENRCNNKKNIGKYDFTRSPSGQSA